MNNLSVARWLTVALTLLMAAVTRAAEFYVDSHASRSGNGLVAAPFRTIQEGINSLKPGDVLLIRGDASGPGRVYLETPSFPHSGVRGSPITIKNVPGEKVIISTGDKIRLERSFIVIQGLVFDHQKADRDAIGVLGQGIVLNECEMRNGSRDGIEIASSAKDVTISNSSIHEFVWLGPNRRDAHCIVASPGATGLRITGNDIYNCSGDGIHLFANDSTPVESYVKGVLVEGNTIYSMLAENSENGLDFKGGVDVIVKRNDIYGFTHNKAVVVQKGAQNVRVEENMIHDSARGMEFRWEAGKVQQNITVSQNVFFNILGQYALKFDGVVNAKVINNTFYKSAGNSIRIEAKGLTGGIIKNNLIHLSGAPRISGSFSAEYSHNGWFSSSAGALASSQDLFARDPLFINPAARNFRLSAQSSAIDKGIFVDLPYAGRAPDLGAFELAGAASPANSKAQ
jgi:hypothetical protein